MITEPEVLQRLGERIDELEERVSRLERDPVAGSPEAAPTATVALQFTDESEPAGSAGVLLTVIGKALLGIAGAYLLRAVASSGAVPRSIVASVAVVYAMAWLFVAVRKAVGSLSGILYAATSGLILAPMLWEMCLRFQAMPPTVAATVLAAYVALIALLARGARGAAAITVAYACSAVTALALSIGTHSMASFTVILLVIVAIGELRKICEGAFPAAPLVYLAADIGMWALLFIYRAPAETRPEYPALNSLAVVAAPLLLFAIHLAGIAIHTLSRRRAITILDALQAMAAFVLVVCASIWLAPNMSRGFLGVLCVGLAAACYWLILGPFRRTASQRNARILGTWGVALFFGSAFLLLLSPVAAVVLGIFAAAAMHASQRFSYPALAIHGVLLTAVAMSASGALEYAAHCMVGSIPVLPNWAVLMSSVLAMLAYVICAIGSAGEGRNLIVRVIAASFATVATSALLIGVLVGASAPLFVLDLFHVAVLRTVALCGLALLLAIAGSRLRRVEVAWMSYVLVAFVTAKLLFEDLRHGRLEFAAVSIGLVAITLILVPRITGRSRSRSAPAQGAD
ncbi:MAG TPA: hypothetical protein VGJ21_14415 [Terracidiphilus sp.]|jgi:hypothetical protein